VRRRGKRVAVARALAAPGASAALDAAANAEMGTLLARLAARIDAARAPGGSGGGATAAASATAITAGAPTADADADQAAPFADVDLLPELQRMALRAMFRFLTVRALWLLRTHTHTSSFLPAHTHAAFAHLHALTPVPLLPSRHVTRRQGVPLPEALRAEAPYLAAAATLRATLPLRSRSVWALVPDALYRLLSPLGRGEAAATSAAHALARAALRCATPASPLGVLAAARAKEAGASRGADGDDEDSLHDAATLLFAGHDTQAATLAWCSLRLAAAPGVAARLRRHCAQAGLYSAGGGAGAAGACADVASSAAARVPLLEAVLRETLRLHPPAPLVVRMLDKAVECPFASSSASSSAAAASASHPPLPGGTAAAVWLYALQRDAAAWGPDADAFRPQRWLRRRRRRHGAAIAADDEDSGSDNDVSASEDAPDGAAEPDTPRNAADVAPLRDADVDADACDDATAASDDSFDAWRLCEGVGGGAYMPYASGPRSCVGAGVAGVALRVMLARLVGGVRLAPGGDAPAAAVQLHPSVGFTVTPAAGVPLRVRLADEAYVAAALSAAAART
jgi:cytochrome P450